MLQSSLVALGVGTLCATAVALNGAGPIEIDPAPEPRPTYLALGGEIVELAAMNHGPGCFEPMLDELRRHPHWSIRIDHLVWDDVVGDRPDPRRETLVIDGETATWRDGKRPQSLALTGAERRDVLAAFALDCRVDETRPPNGYEGDYIGVALGEDSPIVTRFPTNSPIEVRLVELLGAIRARYLATRVDDLRGFSIELAGTMRDYDERDRPTRRPHRVEYHDRLAAADRLEDRVALLDWAMEQPISLPPSNRIARGTLRAYGTSRPIAVDLMNLDNDEGVIEASWSSYGSFGELTTWAAIERPLYVGAPDTGN
jgi:hypothetical protein